MCENNENDGVLEEFLNASKELREMAILIEISNVLLEFSKKLLMFSDNEGLKNAFLAGNILMIVSGVIRNPIDINEFNNVVLNFALDKIKENISNGGEDSDRLLDEIKERFSPEIQEELFKFLDGKITFEEFKKKINKCRYM